MTEPWPFGDLPRRHYGAILADPPWHFELRVDHATGQITGNSTRSAEKHYATMSIEELCALPVGDLAADSCALFMWSTWPMLDRAWLVLEAWGFAYKTCAFAWTKADATQVEMFHDEIVPYMGLGYWTRGNTEPCLLATRGNPKRLNGDVRQAIIAPRRQHSRKPEGIHERVERLVAGPYLELFARQRRPGWDCWGNETDKFAAKDSREWAEMWSKPFDFSQEPTADENTQKND